MIRGSNAYAAAARFKPFPVVVPAWKPLPRKTKTLATPKEGSCRDIDINGANTQLSENWAMHTDGAEDADESDRA